MPVRFSGPNGVEELIPAPLVGISKAYVRDEGGRKLHPEYTITLNGTIVNVGNSKDSPNAQSYDMSMEDILAEQRRIKTLFSVDGGRLEIETPGGGGPNTIDTYCTVDDITFQQSTWTVKCEYTVILKAVKLLLDNDLTTDLTQASETFNITENEDRTYTISHNLSAAGKLFYTVSGVNDPLGAAKQWCQDRLLTNSNGNLSSGHLDFSRLLMSMEGSGNFWNHGIVESPGISANSYQISETFIHNPSGTTREEFSVNLVWEQNDIRKITVSANGAVLGYAENNRDYYTKYSNARTKFDNGVAPNLYTRILPFIPAGYALNPIPVVRQISNEQNLGAVKYGYTFCAVSGMLLDGAIEDSISVNDSGPVDVFAQIPIPGRANGPVVQNMNTYTLPERTVTIQALFTPASGISLSSLRTLYNSKPNTNDIISALTPNNGYYYVKQDTEEWNPIRRNYSRVVSWVIQNEGLSITGMPFAPRNGA